MFSVVKQGREILKVHFMSHYLSESENTGAKFKHLRCRMFVEMIISTKYYKITVIEAITQQISEAVL